MLAKRESKVANLKQLGTTQSVYDRKGAAANELKNLLIASGIRNQSINAPNQVKSNILRKYDQPDANAVVLYGEFVAYKVEPGANIVTPLIAMIPPGHLESADLPVRESMAGIEETSTTEIICRELKRSDVKRIPNYADEKGTLEDEQSIFTSQSGKGFGDAGGWIQKYTGGRWMKRFIVVRGDYVLLFTSPVSEKPMECLHLFEASLTYPSGDLPDGDHGKSFDLNPRHARDDTGYEFKLGSSASHMSLRFACAREEERSAWGDLLNHRINLIPSRIANDPRKHGAIHPSSTIDPFNNPTSKNAGIVITTSRLLQKVSPQSMLPPSAQAGVSDNVTKSSMSESRGSTAASSFPIQGGGAPIVPVHGLQIAQTMMQEASKVGNDKITVQHTMGLEKGMAIMINSTEISPVTHAPVYYRISDIVGNVIYLDKALETDVDDGAMVFGFQHNEEAMAAAAQHPLGILKNSSSSEPNEDEKGESEEKSNSGDGGSAGDIKKALAPAPPIAPIEEEEGDDNSSALTMDIFEDHYEHRSGLQAIADTPVMELLDPGSIPNKVFEKAMKRRLTREEEGRQRELEVFANMEDIEQIIAMQKLEKQAERGPMTLARLLRVLLFFKGYDLVVNPSKDVVKLTGNPTPMMSGNFAEGALIGVYKKYAGNSGFMTIDDLIRFFSDSGIVNTHCPHTSFDEPVVEVAEQLDPLRMLTTMPMPDTLGVNNPSENVASKALQEALKEDQFTINFNQFFMLLLKVTQVVYPQLYEHDPCAALNKVLLESLIPLYSWSVGNEKCGTVDPLLQDERIALLLVTYMPNLWRVFLAYAQDSHCKAPEMDLPFPSFAQACEHALFGVPPGAPYNAPGSQVDRAAAEAADLDLDEEQDLLMRRGSTVFTRSRYMAAPGSAKKMKGDKSTGYSSSMKKTTPKRDDARQASTADQEKEVKSKLGLKPGTLASKREIYRRYSFRSDVALGRTDVSDKRTDIGLTVSQWGDESTKRGKAKAGDKGVHALGAATFKAKQAGLTSAQQKEKRAAMFGMFINQAKLLQFAADYGLVNHLVSRQRVKELSVELNRAKDITLGMKTTALDAKNLQSKVLSKGGHTTAQKLKSKRVSILQSLGKEYLHDDSHVPVPIGAGLGTNHSLFENEVFDRNFKASTKGAISATARNARKAVVRTKDSRLNLNGGLSFSEFMEFLCVVAMEGMATQHYHTMFDTPFKKIQALLTIWGVADIKKLEEVLQMHVDIVL